MMSEQDACLYVLFYGHPGNVDCMRHAPILSHETLPQFLAALPADWPTFRVVVEKLWLPHNGYTIPRAATAIGVEQDAALRVFLRDHAGPALDRALLECSTPNAVFQAVLSGIAVYDAVQFWPTFWRGWQVGRAYRGDT